MDNMAREMMSAATVLVPVERALHATTALPVAHELARLKAATVVLIHVGEPLDRGELLDRLSLSPEVARGLAIEQCTGSPADAIVREAAARSAELIVMCVPTQPDTLVFPVRSIGGNVLRMARCPVVFVPRTDSRESWALHRVLLPHDGTPTSALAVAPAADLASRACAELVVLHVSTPSSKRPTEPGTFVMPRYLDQPQHGWRLWTREFIDRVRGLGHAGNIGEARLVVADGEVDVAILDFARHNPTDLIALAWRGNFAPDRARTMWGVIRQAICPVIVFRVGP
jgi:nucleotide-binding universal stress UspA family protein